MNPYFGVMTVDPGGSSGVCCVILGEERSTVETLSNRELFESETLTGHWASQADKIAATWEDFSKLCTKKGMPSYLVVEDFILIKFKSSDRTGLYPVWIAGCLVGVLGVDELPRMIWQMPSAMQYATDQRLKDWGLWVPGRVHERAAIKHLCYFVHDEKAVLKRKAHRKGIIH